MKKSHIDFNTSKFNKILTVLRKINSDMRKDKRGISTLIATVLIIGITIAAFGIVYTFVMPIVREGIEASKFCADAQLSLVGERGYSCYDSGSGTLYSQIARGPKNTSIDEIQIIYSEAGNSFISTIGPSVGIVQPNGEKVYNVSYNASGFTNIDSVSIAAVVGIGKKGSVCSPSPKITIDAC